MKRIFAFYFPHIIRRYTADKLHIPFGKLFWLFFLVAAASNIFSDLLIPVTKEKYLQRKILKEPYIGTLHEQLGLYYLGVNKEASYKEFLLAQEYYSLTQSINSNVLGIADQPLVKWQDLETKKGQLLTDISYWKNIMKNYPDYQYGLLKISALNLELGEKEEAKKNLDEFLKLTPVDNTAQTLLQKLIN